MLDWLKLHHIGVATKDYKKELLTFSSLGYEVVGSPFKDDVQKVKGIFIEAANQPRLELLENIDKKAGPLLSYLRRGIKFYHFAYETFDIYNDIGILTEHSRAKIVVPITGTESFDKICFLSLPNSMLIELAQVR